MRIEGSGVAPAAGNARQRRGIDRTGRSADAPTFHVSSVDGRQPGSTPRACKSGRTAGSKGPSHRAGRSRPKAAPPARARRRDAWGRPHSFHRVAPSRPVDPQSSAASRRERTPARPLAVVSRRPLLGFAGARPPRPPRAATPSTPIGGPALSPRPIRATYPSRAPVAQLVEHPTFNRTVRGSSPLGRTTPASHPRPLRGGPPQPIAATRPEEPLGHPVPRSLPHRRRPRHRQRPRDPHPRRAGVPPHGDHHRRQRSRPPSRRPGQRCRHRRVQRPPRSPNRRDRPHEGAPVTLCGFDVTRHVRAGCAILDTLRAPGGGAAGRRRLQPPCSPPTPSAVPPSTTPASSPTSSPWISRPAAPTPSKAPPSSSKRRRRMPPASPSSTPSAPRHPRPRRGAHRHPPPTSAATGESIPAPHGNAIVTPCRPPSGGSSGTS